MNKIKTPGIYITETPKFPPSVAHVETSVTVFIGYTATSPTKNDSLEGAPVLINSMLEFNDKFNIGNAMASIKSVDHYLHESIALFYNNGGGKCYVNSVGNLTEKVSLNALVAGLETSKKIAAQLIVIPDSVCLTDAGELGTLQNKMLQCCADLKDRFSILDTLAPTANFENDIDTFRTNIGQNNLKYAAAYYPWITLLNGKTVPPSGAIAGIYSMIDNTRGVWKAPANCNINSITGVSVIIDSKMQEVMNVDVVNGKSINAIRSFSGKGTLVWGARTLDGNSNEWRYISVRRLFIMVEESTKKATFPFVFEPNDANTWVKIRAMLENYLTILWRKGALAGAKPEHAFFVKCGLGQTMTAQEILEGKLIVEIGMAAARPAEFIILQLSHSIPNQSSQNLATKLD